MARASNNDNSLAFFVWPWIVVNWQSMNMDSLHRPFVLFSIHLLIIWVCCSCLYHSTILSTALQLLSFWCLFNYLCKSDATQDMWLNDKKQISMEKKSVRVCTENVTFDKKNKSYKGKAAYSMYNSKQEEKKELHILLSSTKIYKKSIISTRTQFLCWFL